ncbi:MAG: Crp/Fnr family transcriptional regulator [Burkholderiales bacterium]
MTAPEIHNNILAALPRKDYQQMLPDLVPVELVFADVLYEPGARMRDVYFPGDCLVSLLTVVENHLALEVGMVGREGMVGVALTLGAEESPVRALVQGAGPALQMKTSRFLAVLRDCKALQRALNGYLYGLMAQISRTAGCNRFHIVEARLAKWLLMTRDRLASAEFPMTQEFLSSMLGVRRVGVTESATALQRQGLIEYSRGKIRILDGAGLEDAACSCYAAERQGTDGSNRSYSVLTTA